LLEQGISNALPEEEGKAVYVALKCIGEPLALPQFPTYRKILAGRSRIAKSKTRYDTSVGITSGDKQDLIITSIKRTDLTEASKNYPEELLLQYGNTQVVVNNLDLATWIDSEKVTNVQNPLEAAVQLRAFGMEPDFKANNYAIEMEWFTGRSITIFAEAKRKGDVIHLNKPECKIPFIATTQEPGYYAERVRSLQNQRKEKARRYFLEALGVGIGTGALQISDDHRWVQIAEKLRVKKITAFVGIIALGWLANEKLQFVQKLPSKNSNRQ
jgi:hypothetical protein